MEALPKNGEPIITNVKTLTILLKGSRRERMGLKIAVIGLAVVLTASLFVQDDLRANLDETRVSLDSTNQRLVATHDALAFTQESLSHTSAILAETRIYLDSTASQLARIVERSNRYSATWERRAIQDSLERLKDNAIMEAFRKKYNLEP